MAKKILQSLQDAIIQPLSDSFGDIAEFSIDFFIKSEAIKDLPLVGPLVGFYKTGKSINDYFTVKKIYTFLTKLQEIPPEERKAFITKLSENEEYKNEVLEKLLIVLDRFDDTEKAKILGNLLHATIEGKISMSNFLHLASILDRGYIQNIKSFCLAGTLNKDLQKGLVSLGLLVEETEVELRKNRSNGLDMPFINFKYRKTELGHVLSYFAYSEEEKEMYYKKSW